MEDECGKFVLMENNNFEAKFYLFITNIDTKMVTDVHINRKLK